MYNNKNSNTHNGRIQDAPQMHNNDEYIRHNLNSGASNTNTPTSQKPVQKQTTTSVLRQWRRPDDSKHTSKNASVAAPKCSKVPHSAPPDNDRSMNPGPVYPTTPNNPPVSSEYSMYNQQQQQQQQQQLSTLVPSNRTYFPHVQYADSTGYQRASPVQPPKQDVRVPDTVVKYTSTGHYYAQETGEVQFRSTSYPVQSTPPLAHAAKANDSHSYSAMNQKPAPNYHYPVVSQSYHQKMHHEPPKPPLQGHGEEHNAYCLKSPAYGVQNRAPQHGLTPGAHSNLSYSMQNQLDRRLSPQESSQNYYGHKPSCLTQDMQVARQSYPLDKPGLYQHGYGQSYLAQKSGMSSPQSYMAQKSGIPSPQEPKSRDYRQIIPSPTKKSPPFPILEHRLSTDISFYPEYGPGGYAHQKYGPVMLPGVSPTQKIPRDIPVQGHNYLSSSGPKFPPEDIIPSTYAKYYPQNKLPYEQNHYLLQMNQMQSRLNQNLFGRSTELPRDVPYMDQSLRMLQKGRIQYNPLEAGQYAPKSSSAIIQKQSKEHPPGDYFRNYPNLPKQQSVIQSSKMVMDTFPVRSDAVRDSYAYSPPLIHPSARPALAQYPSNYRPSAKSNDLAPGNISPRRTFQENMPVVVIPPQCIGLPKASPPQFPVQEYPQMYPSYLPKESYYPGSNVKPGNVQYQNEQMLKQPIHVSRSLHIPSSRMLPTYPSSQYHQITSDCSEKVFYPPRYGHQVVQATNPSFTGSDYHRGYEPLNEAAGVVRSPYAKKELDIGKSLKEYLESWEDDEDIVANLPDVVLCNNIPPEKQKHVSFADPISEARSVSSVEKLSEDESSREPQPLYILDSTNISSDALSQYLHIQQIDHLPANIKGYYNIPGVVLPLEGIAESSQESSEPMGDQYEACSMPVPENTDTVLQPRQPEAPERVPENTESLVDNPETPLMESEDEHSNIQNYSKRSELNILEETELHIPEIAAELAESPAESTAPEDYSVHKSRAAKISLSADQINADDPKMPEDSQELHFQNCLPRDFSTTRKDNAETKLHGAEKLAEAPENTDTDESRSILPQDYSICKQSSSERLQSEEMQLSVPENTTEGAVILPNSSEDYCVPIEEEVALNLSTNRCKFEDNSEEIHLVPETHGLAENAACLEADSSIIEDKTSSSLLLLPEPAGFPEEVRCSSDDKVSSSYSKNLNSDLCADKLSTKSNQEFVDEASSLETPAVVKAENNIHHEEKQKSEAMLETVKPTSPKTNIHLHTASVIVQNTFFDDKSCLKSVEPLKQPTLPSNRPTLVPNSSKDTENAIKCSELHSASLQIDKSSTYLLFDSEQEHISQFCMKKDSQNEEEEVEENDPESINAVPIGESMNSSQEPFEISPSDINKPVHPSISQYDAQQFKTVSCDKLSDDSSKHSGLEKKANDSLQRTVMNDKKQNIEESSSEEFSNESSDEHTGQETENKDENKDRMLDGSENGDSEDDESISTSCNSNGEETDLDKERLANCSSEGYEVTSRCAIGEDSASKYGKTTLHSINEDVFDQSTTELSTKNERRPSTPEKGTGKQGTTAEEGRKEASQSTVQEKSTIGQDETRQSTTEQEGTNSNNCEKMSTTEESSTGTTEKDCQESKTEQSTMEHEELDQNIEESTVSYGEDRESTTDEAGTIPGDECSQGTTDEEATIREDEESQSTIPENEESQSTTDQGTIPEDESQSTTSKENILENGESQSTTDQSTIPEDEENQSTTDEEDITQDEGSQESQENSTVEPVVLHSTVAVVQSTDCESTVDDLIVLQDAEVENCKENLEFSKEDQEEDNQEKCVLQVEQEVAANIGVLDQDCKQVVINNNSSQSLQEYTALNEHCKKIAISNNASEPLQEYTVLNEQCKKLESSNKSSQPLQEHTVLHQQSNKLATGNNAQETRENTATPVVFDPECQALETVELNPNIPVVTHDNQVAFSSNDNQISHCDNHEAIITAKTECGDLDLHSKTNKFEATALKCKDRQQSIKTGLYCENIHRHGNWEQTQNIASKVEDTNEDTSEDTKLYKNQSTALQVNDTRLQQHENTDLLAYTEQDTGRILQFKDTSVQYEDVYSRNILQNEDKDTSEQSRNVGLQMEETVLQHEEDIAVQTQVTVLQNADIAVQNEEDVAVQNEDTTVQFECITLQFGETILQKEGTVLQNKDTILQSEDRFLQSEDIAPHFEDTPRHTNPIQPEQTVEDHTKGETSSIIQETIPLLKKTISLMCSEDNNNSREASKPAVQDHSGVSLKSEDLVEQLISLHENTLCSEELAQEEMEVADICERSQEIITRMEPSQQEIENKLDRIPKDLTVPQTLNQVPENERSVDEVACVETEHSADDVVSFETEELVSKISDHETAISEKNSLFETTATNTNNQQIQIIAVKESDQQLELEASETPNTITNNTVTSASFDTSACNWENAELSGYSQEVPATVLLPEDPCKEDPAGNVDIEVSNELPGGESFHSIQRVASPENILPAGDMECVVMYSGADDYIHEDPETNSGETVREVTEDCKRIGEQQASEQTAISEQMVRTHKTTVDHVTEQGAANEQMSKTNAPIIGDTDVQTQELTVKQMPAVADENKHCKPSVASEHIITIRTEPNSPELRQCQQVETKQLNEKQGVVDIQTKPPADQQANARQETTATQEHTPLDESLETEDNSYFTTEQTNYASTLDDVVKIKQNTYAEVSEIAVTVQCLEENNKESQSEGIRTIAELEAGKEEIVCIEICTEELQVQTEDEKVVELQEELNKETGDANLDLKQPEVPDKKNVRLQEQVINEEKQAEVKNTTLREHFVKKETQVKVKNTLELQTMNEERPGDRKNVQGIKKELPTEIKNVELHEEAMRKEIAGQKKNTLHALVKNELKQNIRIEQTMKNEILEESINKELHTPIDKKLRETVLDVKKEKKVECTIRQIRDKTSQKERIDKGLIKEELEKAEKKVERLTIQTGDETNEKERIDEGLLKEELEEGELSDQSDAEELIEASPKEKIDSPLIDSWDEHEELSDSIQLQMPISQEKKLLFARRKRNLEKLKAKILSATLSDSKCRLNETHSRTGAIEKIKPITGQNQVSKTVYPYLEVSPAARIPSPETGIKENKESCRRSPLEVPPVGSNRSPEVYQTEPKESCRRRSVESTASEICQHKRRSASHTSSKTDSTRTLNPAKPLVKKSGNDLQPCDEEIFQLGSSKIGKNTKSRSKSTSSGKPSSPRVLQLLPEFKAGSSSVEDISSSDSSVKMGSKSDIVDSSSEKVVASKSHTDVSFFESENVSKSDMVDSTFESQNVSKCDTNISSLARVNVLSKPNTVDKKIDAFSTSNTASLSCKSTEACGKSDTANSSCKTTDASSKSDTATSPYKSIQSCTPTSEEAFHLPPGSKRSLASVEDKELFINPENPRYQSSAAAGFDPLACRKRSLSYTDYSSLKIEFKAPKRRYSAMEPARPVRKPVINLDEISRNITEVLERFDSTGRTKYDETVAYNRRGTSQGAARLEFTEEARNVGTNQAAEKLESIEARKIEAQFTTRSQRIDTLLHADYKEKNIEVKKESHEGNNMILKLTDQNRIRIDNHCIEKQEKLDHVRVSANVTPQKHLGAYPLSLYDEDDSAMNVKGQSNRVAGCRAISQGPTTENPLLDQTQSLLHYKFNQNPTPTLPDETRLAQSSSSMEQVDSAHQVSDQCLTTSHQPRQCPVNKLSDVRQSVRRASRSEQSLMAHSNRLTNVKLFSQGKQQSVDNLKEPMETLACVSSLQQSILGDVTSSDDGDDVETLGCVSSSQSLEERARSVYVPLADIPSTLIEPVLVLPKVPFNPGTRRISDVKNGQARSKNVATAKQSKAGKIVDESPKITASSKQSKAGKSGNELETGKEDSEKLEETEEDCDKLEETEKDCEKLEETEKGCLKFEETEEDSEKFEETEENCQKLEKIEENCQKFGETEENYQKLEETEDLQELDERNEDSQIIESNKEDNQKSKITEEENQMNVKRRTEVKTKYEGKKEDSKMYLESNKEQRQKLKRANEIHMKIKTHFENQMKIKTSKERQMKIKRLKDKQMKIKGISKHDTVVLESEKNFETKMHTSKYESVPVTVQCKEKKLEMFRSDGTVLKSSTSNAEAVDDDVTKVECSSTVDEGLSVVSGTFGSVVLQASSSSTAAGELYRQTGLSNAKGCSSNTRDGLESSIDSSSNTEASSSGSQSSSSDSQGSSSYIPAKNLNCEGGISNFETVTSNIEVGTSNVEVGTSNVEARTSNVEIGTSNIEAEKSNFEAGESNIKNRSSNIQTETSNIKESPSNTQTGPSKIETSPLAIKIDSPKTQRTSKNVKSTSSSNQSKTLNAIIVKLHSSNLKLASSNVKPDALKATGSGACGRQVGSLKSAAACPDVETVPLKTQACSSTCRSSDVIVSPSLTIVNDGSSRVTKGCNTVDQHGHVNQHAVTLDQPTSTVDQLAATIGKQVSAPKTAIHVSPVDQHSGSVDEQPPAVEQLATTVDKLASVVDQLAPAVDIRSASVDQSSAAVDQLIPPKNQLATTVGQLALTVTNHLTSPIDQHSSAIQSTTITALPPADQHQIIQSCPSNVIISPKIASNSSALPASPLHCSTLPKGNPATTSALCNTAPNVHNADCSVRGTTNVDFSTQHASGASVHKHSATMYNTSSTRLHNTSPPIMNTARFFYNMPLPGCNPSALLNASSSAHRTSYNTVSSYKPSPSVIVEPVAPKRKVNDPRIDKPAYSAVEGTKSDLIENKLCNTFRLTEYTKNYIKMKTGQSVDTRIANGLQRSDPRLGQKQHTEADGQVVQQRSELKRKMSFCETDASCKAARDKRVKINLQDYRNRKQCSNSWNEARNNANDYKNRLSDDVKSGFDDCLGEIVNVGFNVDDVSNEELIISKEIMNLSRESVVETAAVEVTQVEIYMEDNIELIPGNEEIVQTSKEEEVIENLLSESQLTEEIREVSSRESNFSQNQDRIKTNSTHRSSGGGRKSSPVSDARQKRIRTIYKPDNGDEDWIKVGSKARLQEESCRPGPSKVSQVRIKEGADSYKASQARIKEDDNNSYQVQHSRIETSSNVQPLLFCEDKQNRNETIPLPKSAMVKLTKDTIPTNNTNHTEPNITNRLTNETRGEVSSATHKRLRSKGELKMYRPNRRRKRFRNLYATDEDEESEVPTKLAKTSKCLGQLPLNDSKSLEQLPQNDSLTVRVKSGQPKLKNKEDVVACRDRLPSCDSPEDYSHLVPIEPPGQYKCHVSKKQCPLRPCEERQDINLSTPQFTKKPSYQNGPRKRLKSKDTDDSQGSLPSCSGSVDSSEQGVGQFSKKLEYKCHINLSALANKSNALPCDSVQPSTSKVGLKLTLKSVRKQAVPVLHRSPTRKSKHGKKKVPRKELTAAYSVCPGDGSAANGWVVKDKVPKVIIKRNGSGYCAVSRDISSNPIWQPVIRVRRHRYIESLVKNPSATEDAP